MISKRERYLIVVITALGGCYGLFLAVRGLFLGPLEAQVSQIRSLTSDIASKEKQMDEIFAASSRLAEWEKLSLPGDEGDAQALYQDYLFKLMRDCHFEEPQVSADKTQRAKAFTSIPFTIRGKVSLENLTEFLYRFRAYEPMVMHQVRSLTIGRSDGKNKNLTVTIIVAALALDNAPHRGALIAEGDNPRSLTIDDLPLEKFAMISKKNIFEPYREAPTKEPNNKPEVDAARHVVYSGCTQTGDEPEAWIYDRLNNANKFLRAGDDLAIAGLKGKIISVTASSLVIQMDDKEWSLKLGKNFRELKEIGRSVVKTEGSEPAGGSSEPEKVPQTSPPESAPSEDGKTSDEKPDKIGVTIPVKKDVVASEREVTAADGGS